MAHIDKHKPGSFCWIELSTNDQHAAKSFYSSLFGWEANDIPMGPNEAYTIFKLQGGDVSAACTLRPDQRSQGVPPHWLLYVAADNADAAANRAAQAGGKVLAPAFDVMDVGRMAVLQDPTGAVLCVWQAKRHVGVTVTDVDGTLCWADLSTPDQTRAGKFYSDLFGWKLTGDTDDDPPSEYLHIQNGEDFIGGIPPAAHRDANTPAHWLPYFLVSNCDASAAKAKQLGAKFYLEPMTMENVGRFGVLADPQGAVFAIFQSMPRK
jgi:predicted enzyme related to lactoylglutathione lyase